VFSVFGGGGSYYEIKINRFRSVLRVKNVWKIYKSATKNSAK